MHTNLFLLNRCPINMHTQGVSSDFKKSPSFYFFLSDEERGHADCHVEMVKACIYSVDQKLELQKNAKRK